MSGPGRAVVLGATGLVGSELVRQLLDDNWEVAATIRDPSSIAPVLDAVQGAQVVTLADALDGEAISRVLAEHCPDVVINCMSTNPTWVADAARAYGSMNVTAVAVVLDACVRSNVGRAIVIGSGFEYSPAASPLDENSPIGPNTLYGATKASGSVVAHYFRNFAALDVCVARPFSVYGPRERLTRFVPSAITAALSGRPIEMSSGRQTRDYLYVADMAEGLVRLASHEGPLPETVNFAGPEVHSLLDVALRVVELAGSGAGVHSGSRAENPGDRPVFLGDCRRARETLGWLPQHDLQSGLAKTLDWYKTHRSLWETPA